MPSLLITGFKTKEQVQAFVDWYEGQGEQDATVWFECRCAEGELDVDFMPVNMKTITNPLAFDSENQATIELEMKNSYR